MTSLSRAPASTLLNKWWGKWSLQELLMDGVLVIREAEWQWEELMWRNWIMSWNFSSRKHMLWDSQRNLFAVIQIMWSVMSFIHKMANIFDSSEFSLLCCNYKSDILQHVLCYGHNTSYCLCILCDILCLVLLNNPLDLQIRNLSTLKFVVGRYFI